METQHIIGLSFTTYMYPDCARTQLRDILIITFFFPLATATTPSETIQPLNHINCKLILQITAWSVGQPQAQSSHKILLSTYYTKGIVFSRELKYKYRTLPLLALKELKIGLGEEVILLSIPYAYETISNNSKRNDTVSKHYRISFVKENLEGWKASCKM